MYISLKENIVSEIIPDENPVFPGIPISERYAPDFVAELIHVPDDTEVEQHWVYDPESETFSKPPEPELVSTPGPEPAPAPEPDPQADTDAMMVDHELRLTMLELGLTSEEEV